MKLVVGLGNPGRRYAGTRHNVGFRVVAELARRGGIELSERRFEGRFGRGRAPELGGLDLGVLQPDTWMNRSGGPVAEALRYLPVEDPSRDLCVVLDDADLPFGRLRVRPGGSDGGHRGLGDVLATLGCSDIPRLRFGIGRPEGRMETADFVLAGFSADEERDLPAHLGGAVDALACFLVDGVTAAMNRYNPA